MSVLQVLVPMSASTGVLTQQDPIGVTATVDSHWMMMGSPAILVCK